MRLCEQRIELSQLVASAVHRKNRDIQIESAEGLVRALGEEAVTDLLNFFERNGDLDLTHLNAIEAGYPAATHVLAVRIDRNHVDQSTSRMSYDNKDKPKAKAHYDANGKLVLDNFAMGSETVTAVDTYTTSRDLAILVEIFDVAKGITVWSGHVHKRHSTNATQQNQYSANHHDRFKEELSQALAKGIVSGLTGTKVNNYPEPISTQDLLGELLITFGQKLP